VLSVITSIGLDHTHILGSTKAEITREKCGIIKRHTPVVIGPTVPLFPTKAFTRPLRSKLIRVEGPFLDFQQENNKISETCLAELSSNRSILSRSLPQDAIYRALQHNPPCRFQQVIWEGVSVLLDVCHNPPALSRLFELIRMKFPNRTLRCVFGMSKDKDIKSCLNILAKSVAHLHLVKPSSPRSATVDELKALVPQGASQCKVYTDFGGDVTSTVQLAIQRAGESSRLVEVEEAEIVVVCGTFYIMRDAAKAVGIEMPTDPLDVNEHFWHNPQKKDV